MEETGLIVPLGEWVLRTACALARAWNDEGLPPLAMGVNLSSRQLHQPDLVQRVRAILEETGLPPAQLTLEPTESAVMGHNEEAFALLHSLKSLGVSLTRQGCDAFQGFLIGRPVDPEGCVRMLRKLWA